MQNANPECQASCQQAAYHAMISRVDPHPQYVFSGKPDHGSWFPVASNYLCALPEKHTYAPFAIIIGMIGL